MALSMQLGVVCACTCSHLSEIRIYGPTMVRLLQFKPSPILICYEQFIMTLIYCNLIAFKVWGDAPPQATRVSLGGLVEAFFFFFVTTYHQLK